MIVCFNCSRETKRILDNLRESGDYTDYNEIITIAIQNLEVLYTELQKSGGIIISDDKKADLSTQRKDLRKKKKMRLRSTIPRTFLLEDPPDSLSNYAEFPKRKWSHGQDVSLDNWLFGQYNRLLPAKASCRSLSHFVMDNTEGVKLEEMAGKIAESAAYFGDYLRVYEEVHNIHRDDRLSVAFPTTGSGAEKSQARFSNQFVGSLSSSGELSGLLFGMKLINQMKKGVEYISLTEAGWKFALLSNPILENDQDNPTDKLSLEESEYLVEHINKHVPVEDFAYRAILRAIKNGIDTPGKIDEELKKYMSSFAEKKFSASFLSSQRSGAISRMTDLKLVERVREGIHVRYVMTTFGKEYLRE